MPSQIYKILFFIIVCMMTLQKGAASLSDEEEREESISHVRGEASSYVRWVQESWDNMLVSCPNLKENLLIESERFLHSPIERLDR